MERPCGRSTMEVVEKFDEQRIYPQLSKTIWVVN